VGLTIACAWVVLENGERMEIPFFAILCIENDVWHPKITSTAAPSCYYVIDIQLPSTPHAKSIRHSHLTNQSIHPNNGKPMDGQQ
jgi:hypothetical protein